MKDLTIEVSVRLRGRRVLNAVAGAAVVARVCRIISDECAAAWVNWAIARCTIWVRIGRRGEWLFAGKPKTRMYVEAAA